MSSDIQQLVAEVAQVTGAALPNGLDGDAPVLRDEALKRDGDTTPYLIGLIGGKEVGKSALVNALVGQPITDSTSSVEEPTRRSTVFSAGLASGAAASTGSVGRVSLGALAASAARSNSSPAASARA